jgi:hypothetical protein
MNNHQPTFAYEDKHTEGHFTLLTGQLNLVHCKRQSDVAYHAFDIWYPGTTW